MQKYQKSLPIRAPQFFRLKRDGRESRCERRLGADRFWWAAPLWFQWSVRTCVGIGHTCCLGARAACEFRYLRGARLLP